jgi:hypothetical protein
VFSLARGGGTDNFFGAVEWRNTCGVKADEAESHNEEDRAIFLNQN